MTIFLTVLAAFLFLMAIMAIGVMLGRKPLTGSCGGVGRALGEQEYECPICGDDPSRCEKADSTPAAREDAKQWYEVR